VIEFFFFYDGLLRMKVKTFINRMIIYCTVFGTFSYFHKCVRKSLSTCISKQELRDLELHLEKLISLEAQLIHNLNQTFEVDDSNL